MPSVSRIRMSGDGLDLVADAYGEATAPPVCFFMAADKAAGHGRDRLAAWLRRAITP